MSDITLDFSGVILSLAATATLLIFSAIAVAALVACIVKAKKNGGQATGQRQFAYVKAAGLVTLLNLVTAGAVAVFLDKASRDTKNILELFLIFGWLPSGFILFAVFVRLFRRRETNL